MGKWMWHLTGEQFAFLLNVYDLAGLGEMPSKSEAMGTVVAATALGLDQFEGEQVERLAIVGHSTMLALSDLLDDEYERLLTFLMGYRLALDTSKNRIAQPWDEFRSQYVKVEG